MEDMFRVGVITQPHGVHGEVKVFPTTEDPKRFKKLKTVILNDGKTSREVEITSVKFFKNMVILKFKEFNNMNEAELLRKAELWVTRENAIPLEEGEYYVADLIGLKVVSTEGEDLGILDDVLETGANDVYVVVKENTPDLLLPAIPQCIQDVDLEEGVMTVFLMPGLRD